MGRNRNGQEPSDADGETHAPFYPYAATRKTDRASDPLIAQTAWNGRNRLTIASLAE